MRGRFDERVIMGVSIAVGTLVVLLLAWMIDGRAHADTVARGVGLAGQAIGGADRSEVEQTVSQVALTYRDALVRIRSDKGDLDATAAGVGLVLDQQATVEAAMAFDHDGANPLSWSRSVLQTRAAPLRFTVDRAQLAAGIAELDKATRVEPTEPTLVSNDQGLTSVPGTTGRAVDLEALAEELRRSAETGSTPVIIDVAPKPLAPRFSENDAKELANRATELTKTPFALSIGGKSATIPPKTLRTWVGGGPGPNGLELRVDQARIEAELPALVGNLGNAPVPARFTVAGDKVQIVDGQNGTRCCAPDSAQRVAAALAAGQSTATLDMQPVPPSRDRAAAERLGIIEPIGTFTTPHACCEGRVTNIHRFADLIRGTVFEPGQTLSLNDAVGQRTEAKGFVDAPVIYNNTHDHDIGGGVSQFATTIFNAAFFGGLDFVEYQSHSQFITRYPYGREATISWTKPDLKIKNNTPHGILVWPTYTDTSLTVTLYGTKYVSGEQTGQSESPAGPCTRVRTERTRTWVADGRRVVDSVSALYQPADGVRCP